MKSDRDRRTVVIIATGGTIAGTGRKGRETGYTSGTLDVSELIDAVPGIGEIADIRAIQICNVNSDDITSKIWIELTDTVNRLSRDEAVAGFVITHGTDTMEETAYFLNMTVKTDKPVVLTGSMRPSTSISADGPMNLYQSVCVAAAKESRGKGVLVVFSNRIFSARSVKKMSTYNVMAISAGEAGCIGVIRDDEAIFHDVPTKSHTVNTEFNVRNGDILPRVQILYFAVDSDTGILEYAASRFDGLVIAGAGAGEFSREYKDIISTLRSPVVVSSRVNDGIITQDAVLCENTIAANDLSPQKAAILLRLAIMDRLTSKDELIRIFGSY